MTSMSITDYEAKRMRLDEEMQKVNARQAEHEMELSVKYQTEMKRISTQIGALKSKRGEITKKYQIDKSWLRKKYRDEKEDVTRKMHLLRLEYLTANGLPDNRAKKVTPHRRGILWRRMRKAA